MTDRWVPIEAPLTEARSLELLEQAARAFDHAAGPLSVHPSNILMTDRDVKLGEGGIDATRDLSVAVVSLGATLAAFAPERTPAFDALLAKMRAADRRDRPQTPAELMADIAAVREGRSPTPPSKRIPGWLIPLVFGGVVVAGLVVALVGGRPGARYIEQEGGKHRLVYRFTSRSALADWFPARKGGQPDRPDLVDEMMAPGDASYWCTVPFTGDVILEAQVVGPQATVTVSVGKDGSAFFGRATYDSEFVLKLAGMPVGEPVPLEWKGSGRIRIVKTAGQVEFFLEDRSLAKRSFVEPAGKGEDTFLFAVQGPARYGRIGVVGRIVSTWFKK